MLDFLMISTKVVKDTLEIHPKFKVISSSDLMIRGGDFYAIWDEDAGVWRTDESYAVKLIDKELERYSKENKNQFIGREKIMYMWDSDSGSIDKWHKYCQKQMWDNYHPLDETLIFNNMPTRKEDYSSKRLPYNLEKGDFSAFDELISVLYSPENRHKIEWCIGAIVSGDSKHIQKFLVLYGMGGTGKSTIIDIIEKMFEGYCGTFSAKNIGSSNAAFAMEALKNNPLIALQHDGDLSKIEDNTRLNSLISHETMVMEEKFKSAYPMRFNSFLIMGTNKPVKITDARSGIIRRLIDAMPSGDLVAESRYFELKDKIYRFELGAIAYHCLEVYKANPNAYSTYKPLLMLTASNDFYNYVLENFDDFEKIDGITLTNAYERYNKYCEVSKVPFPYPRMRFQEELRTYFRDFFDRKTLKDGSRVRSYFSGFIKERFENNSVSPPDAEDDVVGNKIIFKEQSSLFDYFCRGCFAQYANSTETPARKWSDVRTILNDISTRQLHYVKVPENHIVIDFDLKDENNEKSFALNLEAASRWPATYAELSKSGKGIHLHYIYDGDVNKLSRIYDKDIEVKVFTGNSSLRRKLTLCNDIPIAHVSFALPLKEEKKVVEERTLKSERSLRILLLRIMRKEINGCNYTKPCVDFMVKVLQDAFDSGMQYSVEDMLPDIIAFAADSTNNADYCLKKIDDMKLSSESKDDILTTDYSQAPYAFFDVEVAKNLFILCWKYMDEEVVHKLINPDQEDIIEFIKPNKRLIGFNNRKYDNHILWGRSLGYSNMDLYQLSQSIIERKTGFFREAYNLSYTDIYDFASEKKSLKKWEIELKIHHQEFGLPWDQPIPEDRWEECAEYCANDVLATEAVFKKRQGDFLAREILAAVADGTPNDTTNTLTTKIIFGKNKNPDLVYTNLAEMFPGYEYVTFVNDKGKFEKHNMYRGEDVGFGGYVYAEPGMYGRAVTFDVASMHPSSVIAMNCFGEYTQRFKDILDARIAIKHKDFEKAKTMLNGKLAPYLTDPAQAKMLAQALKIAINSVYGLTSASFDNPFRDPRNVNNIVALRGALFMVNLKHEVQERGFKVIHIKTDSIKIENPDKDICDFVVNYGKQYGYNFEIEHIFERICLVNNAVYIAKLAKDDPERPGEWEATGAEFAHPYIFKKLFTQEPIDFYDMCETKSVAGSIYLDFNEKTAINALNEIKTSNFPKLLKLDDESYIMDMGNYEKLLEKYLKATGKDLSDNGASRKFVGKVGLFIPVEYGYGGGVLLREKDGKYAAVEGTKGYRWFEAEDILDMPNVDSIVSKRYFRNLIDGAIESISSFGDFERFVGEEEY